MHTKDWILGFVVRFHWLQLQGFVDSAAYARPMPDSCMDNYKADNMVSVNLKTLFSLRNEEMGVKMNSMDPSKQTSKLMAGM